MENILENRIMVSFFIKPGNKPNSTNYRAITFTNKNFQYHTTKKYQKLFEEKKLPSPCEAGFRKVYRTMDYIFTLLNLSHKKDTIKRKVPLGIFCRHYQRETFHL